MLKEIFDNIFKYNNKEKYNFILSETTNNINKEEFEKKDTTLVSSNLSSNIEYLKVKYNMLINSDIKTREFTLSIKPYKFSACLIYIDGMVDNDSINDYILKPLLLKNSIKMKSNEQNTLNLI